MKKWILFPSLFFLLLGNSFSSNPINNTQVASFAEAKTLVLYEAASGDIPNKSLLAFTDFPPGSAVVTYVDGATSLDTTSAGNEPFAGWVSSQATTTGFPILDRTAGVQLNFTLQIESETHTNNHRAGFSVILLDQDAKGIELSFWENEIWAQSDDQTGGLFRHAEGAAFTTTNLTVYQLTIVGDIYTLSANSMPLLTGPVRDYKSFSGFPDPYETPNFLFLGDDTTSSQSRMKLGFISITGTEPFIPTIAVTSTSATIPTNIPSSTPLPSATHTPFPTPTTSRPVIEFCPSGWLFGIVIIINAVMINQNRRHMRNF